MTVLPDPPVFSGTPMAQITPFTYREGATLMYIIELLKRWSVELGPEVQAIIDEALDELTKYVDDAKIFWENKFDEFIANIVQELEALNDQAVANLVNSISSLTREALNKNFVENNELVVNVADHGAVGDGITDDTTAFQNAVNYIQNNGGRGTLYLPGDHAVNGVVSVFAKSLTVVGAPGATVRKTVNSTHATVFAVLAGNHAGYGATDLFYAHGIKWYGDLGNNKACNPVSAHKCSHVKMLWNEFYGCQMNGHVADLQGCTLGTFLWNTFAGIKPQTGREYVEAVQVDASYRGGSGFPSNLAENELYDGTPTKRVIVNNNRFIPYTAGGVTYPAPMPVGSHVYVDGMAYDTVIFNDNYLENVTASSGFNSILHFTGLQNLVAKRNEVRGNHSQLPFIRINTGATSLPLADVSVVGATTKTAQNRIYPEAFNVSENDFYNLTYNEAIVWLYGLNTRKGKNMVIDNNRFYNCNRDNPTNYLVYFTQCIDVHTKGNKSYGSNSSHTFIGSCDNPIIESPYGDGGAGFPINVVGSSNPVLINPVFRGYAKHVNFSETTNSVTVRNPIVSHSVDAPGIMVTTPPATGVIGRVSIIGGDISTTSTVLSADSQGIFLSPTVTRGVVALNTITGFDVPVYADAGVTQIGNI